MNMDDPFVDFNRAPSMDLDEYFPVDNFFDNYVSQLENTGAASFMSSHSESARGPSAMPSYNVATQPLPGVPLPRVDPHGASSLSEMLNPTPFAAAQPPPLQAPLQPYASPQYQTSPSHNPNIAFAPGPSHVGHGSLGFMSSSGFATSSGSGGVGMVQQPLLPVPKVEEAGTLEAKAKSTSGRNRNRTIRQQTLNKQAQQRYRQRKKAKAVELEMAVEALSDEIQQLKAVKEEKRLLEERTLELEKKLLEKEGMIERMKMHPPSKRGSEKDSNCSDMSSTDLEKDSDREPSQNAAEFHSKVHELGSYLRQHSLEPSQRAEASTKDVAEPVLRGLAKGIYEVCMTCVRILRLDGPNMFDLIQAKVGSGINFEPHGRDRWIEIAESLQLTAEQRKMAGMLRSQHLEKLEKIFIDRQSLNLSAISLLLPNDQGGQAPTFGKLSCFSITSLIQRSKHSNRTHHALDRLKSNLREEQKLLSELEYMTYNRVLNPIQGAWAILGTYPHHCDCLALLSAVCELKPSEKTGETSVPDWASQTAQDETTKSPA